MEKPKPESRTKWVAPEEDGAIILTGPQIPKPLHTVAPRNIIGQSAWDKIRKRCYFLAGYKCQACGADVSSPGTAHAHELYTTDYESGTATFVRPICLCRTCHLLCFHNGRALTLYKHDNPLYTKDALLRGAEHCFSLLHDWNKNHPDTPPLKAYYGYLDYLKQPRLKEKMETLIEKYKVEFWKEDKKRRANWADWKLIYNGKDYLTPYKNFDEWESKMDERRDTDNESKVRNVFSGGVYDEIEKLLEDEENEERII